jgi:hypothetical protein
MPKTKRGIEKPPPEERERVAALLQDLVRLAVRLAAVWPDGAVSTLRQIAARIAQAKTPVQRKRFGRGGVPGRRLGTLSQQEVYWALIDRTFLAGERGERVTVAGMARELAAKSGEMPDAIQRKFRRASVAVRSGPNLLTLLKEHPRNKGGQ